MTLLIPLLQPCNVRNWELQVHLKIHGKGKDLFGDGMAIWYAKDRMVPGPVFGNMDYHHGLAVIIDTYSNHNGPHNVSIIIHLKTEDFVIKISYKVLLFILLAPTSIHISND